MRLLLSQFQRSLRSFLVQTLVQENHWRQWLALVDVVTSIQQSCAGWQGRQREQSLFRSRQEGSRGPRLFDYIPNSTVFWRALQETYDGPTIWAISCLDSLPDLTTWNLNQIEDLFHHPSRAWKLFGQGFRCSSVICIHLRNFFKYLCRTHIIHYFFFASLDHHVPCRLQNGPCRTRNGSINPLQAWCLSCLSHPALQSCQIVSKCIPTDSMWWLWWLWCRLNATVATDCDVLTLVHQRQLWSKNTWEHKGQNVSVQAVNQKCQPWVAHARALSPKIGETTLRLLRFEGRSGKRTLCHVVLDVNSHFATVNLIIRPSFLETVDSISQPPDEFPQKFGFLEVLKLDLISAQFAYLVWIVMNCDDLWNTYVFFFLLFCIRFARSWRHS